MTGIKNLYEKELESTKAPITVSNAPSTKAEKEIQEEKEKSDSELAGELQKRLLENFTRPGEEKWGDYMLQYESKTTFKPDGRANINRPIEKATIRNKMSDELSMKPNVKLIPMRPEDIYRVEIMKRIWDFVWREADTDKELTKMFQEKGIFGTGWWFEGVHSEIRTKWIPKINEDGYVDKEKKIEKLSWLKGYVLDIRNVWVEPVEDIELADWCYIRDISFSKEKLDNLRNDPNYKNIDEAMQWKPTTTTTPTGFQTKTDKVKSIGNDSRFVRWMFFCKSKGQYIETVGTMSGSMGPVIRNGAMPFMHGELPITPLPDNIDFMEMYGHGQCSLLESTKYEINTTENQIIDYARESNTINIAVGDGVAFQDSEMINGIINVWNFSGDLGNSQIIKPPAMDGGLNNVREMLENNATYDTGIDNRAIMGNPVSTAYQARIQEQTRLKGVNLSMRNVDVFYTRIFRQRLSNIQQFLPVTTGRQIVGNAGENRTIPLEDTLMTERKGKAAEKAGKVPMVKEKTGMTSFLELNSEILESTLAVYVDTPTTSPIIKDIEKEDKRAAIAEVLNLIALNPELVKDINFKAIMKSTLEDYDIDSEKFLNSAEGIDVADIRQSILDQLPQPSQGMTQPNRAKPQTPSLQAQPPQQQPNQA